ncbi:MAG TPA: GNAT family N-acetyltransferase [Candidatus Omnitrophica bacterium]|nr:GNAT family N-acetyltransferase [Candidatus Omnitrophota bacterium]
MFKVLEVNKSDLKGITTLFDNNYEGVLLEDRSISRESKLEYIIAQFTKGDRFFAVKEADKILALAGLKKEDWDTEHFGIKMASLKIKSIAKGKKKRRQVSRFLIGDVVKTANKEGYQHISIKINPEQKEEIFSLEEADFYYVTSLITYIVDLKGFSQSPSEALPFIIDDYKSKDLTELKKIAYESFSDRKAWSDRFHNDPYLDNRKCDELYVKWLTNCCLGKEADIVLVARKDDRPLGFISAKYDRKIKRFLGKKVASIPLNAVDKRCRRQGIYKSLVYKMLSILKRRSTDYAMITTQLNTLAVRKVWHNIGSRIESLKLVFHKKL